MDSYNNNDVDDFLCANILGDRAQWHNKTNVLTIKQSHNCITMDGRRCQESTEGRQL